MRKSWYGYIGAIWNISLRILLAFSDWPTLAYINICKDKAKCSLHAWRYILKSIKCYCESNATREKCLMHSIKLYLFPPPTRKRKPFHGHLFATFEREYAINLTKYTKICGLFILGHPLILLISVVCSKKLDKCKLLQRILASERPHEDEIIQIDHITEPAHTVDEKREK